MSPALPAVRILVADDDGDVLRALQLLLKGEGYEIVVVPSPSGVLEAVREQDFDAILLDLNYTRDTTSGREGLDLLAKLQELDSTIPIIVMTAWASVETAVEAMRRGAADYLPKPLDLDELRLSVDRALDRLRADRELAYHRQRTSSARDQVIGVIGNPVREAGLRIPADVAIVGFDDIPAASWIRPRLTTIAQFPTEMGHQLATMLFERLEGSFSDPGRRIEVPCRLIERESA